MTKEENDQERVRAQLDILLKLVEQETSAFSNIGGLAIALIVILSLNNALVIFNPTESKILLTIFLVLTMITLGVHSYFLNSGKQKSINIIEEIMGKKIFNQIQRTPVETVTAYVPRVVIIVFLCCLFYTIYVIWRS